MIWREDTPMQGIYLQSTDSGDTWSQPLAVDTPARQFMVEDDGRYIYVSYLKKLMLTASMIIKFSLPSLMMVATHFLTRKT